MTQKRTKLGYLSLEMAIPIILMDHPESTKEEIYDIVKHKVSQKDFNKAWKFNDNWNNISPSFKQLENKKVEVRWQVRDDFGSLRYIYTKYIGSVMEALAEETLYSPEEIEMSLKVRTKDIHRERLINDIKTLSYVVSVEDVTVRT